MFDEQEQSNPYIAATGNALMSGLLVSQATYAMVSLVQCTFMVIIRLFVFTYLHHGSLPVMP